MKKQFITLLLLVVLSMLITATLFAENNDGWETIYTKLLYDNNLITHFGLYDINKDGTLELLCVTSEDKVWAQKIIIYTIDNKNPIPFFEIVISDLNEYALIGQDGINNFAFAAPADKDEIGIYYTVKDWWSGGALSIYKIIPTAEGVKSFKNADIRSDFFFNYDEKQANFLSDEYRLNGEEVTRDDIYSKIGTAITLYPIRTSKAATEFNSFAQYNIGTIINSSRNNNNREILYGKNNPMFLYELMGQISLNQAIGVYVSYPNGFYDAKMFSFINDIENTYLFMLNGSFVPGIDIHETESGIYLPLRKVCELLGDDLTELESEGEAKIVDDTIYVPLDFFKENYMLNIEISNLFMDVNLYIVTFDDEYPYLIADSIQHAKQSIEYVMNDCYITQIENDNTLTRTRLQNEVSYETEIGPYYIFYVAKYERLKIFVNKYTGEIYSMSGISHFSVDPGLPAFNFATVPEMHRRE